MNDRGIKEQKRIQAVDPGEKEKVIEVHKEPAKSLMRKECIRQPGKKKRKYVDEIENNKKITGKKH